MNRFIDAALSVGHESSVGILSAQTSTNYVRFNSSFQIGPQLAVGTNFSFEDTNQPVAFNPSLGIATLGSTTNAHFQLLSLSLSTSYQLTKKLNASLSYSFVERTAGGSNTANDSYTQNRFVLALGYQF